MTLSPGRMLFRGEPATSRPDVVTAGGDLIRADEAHHPDLLWAARGAGPGFPGVVTRFHLRTYPAPPVMWHDTATFRLDDTVALLTWLHAVLRDWTGGSSRSWRPPGWPRSRWRPGRPARTGRCCSCTPP